MPDEHARMFLKRIVSIGFVDKGACEGADIIVAKRGDDHAPVVSTAAVDPILAELVKRGAKMSRARKAQLKAALKTLSEILQEVGDDEEDDRMSEDTSKREAPPAVADPPVVAHVSPDVEVTKQLADTAKRLVDAEKRAADAEALAQAERDARLTTEAVQKVGREFPHLPVTAEQFGRVWKRACSTLAPEDLGEFDRVLKAANEAFRLQTVSRGVDGTPSGDRAIDKLNAIAADLVSKGAVKTASDGLVKAAELHPDLYATYTAEMRRRS